MYRDCLFNYCISFGHLGGPVATEIHLLKKNTHSPVTILSKIASCHGESLARSAISEAFETQFVCETCALDPFALLLQHLGLLLGVSKGTFKSSNPKGTSLNHPTPGVLGCVTKKACKKCPLSATPLKPYFKCSMAIPSIPISLHKLTKNHRQAVSAWRMPLMPLLREQAHLCRKVLSKTQCTTGPRLNRDLRFLMDERSCEKVEF